MNLNNNFLEILPTPIILFGAGDGGKYCYTYLQKMEQAENVIGFIDNDLTKQGGRLFGKPIYAFNYLKDHPNIAVVITTAYYPSIVEKMHELKMPNPIFCYLNFMPEYLDTDEFNSNINFIQSFYEKDDCYTMDILETVIEFRANNHFCHIQPYDIAKTLRGNREKVDGYWYDKKTKLKENELTICDCGAFTGDTIDDWIKNYEKQIKQIYAFEPDPATFTILEKNTVNKPVKCFPFGLGNENTTLTFAAGNGTASHVSEKGSTIIKICRMDDLDIPVIGKLCIKMDIEGSELSLLEGAKETIKKYKPNLAICVYHKLNDIWRLPQYIKSLVPEYNCVLRNGNHMVCYATIDSD